jgi:hypothetical protein
MSQFLPVVVLVLAWFFLKWLDRRRAVSAQDSEEVSWQKTKRKMKYIAGGLVLVFAFQGYSNWSDEREVAKARAAMTPAQRAAADAAASERAAEQARLAQKEAQEKRFREACTNKLLSAMHDPGSADLSWVHGSVNASGVFIGTIEGRAKNAFGALVKGSWLCEAAGSGNAIAVISLSQLSP